MNWEKPVPWSVKIIQGQSNRRGAIASDRLRLISLPVNGVWAEGHAERDTGSLQQSLIESKRYERKWSGHDTAHDWKGSRFIEKRKKISTSSEFLGMKKNHVNDLNSENLWFSLRWLFVVYLKSEGFFRLTCERERGIPGQGITTWQNRLVWCESFSNHR